MPTKDGSAGCAELESWVKFFFKAKIDFGEQETINKLGIIRKIPKIHTRSSLLLLDNKTLNEVNLCQLCHSSDSNHSQRVRLEINGITVRWKLEGWSLVSMATVLSMLESVREPLVRIIAKSRWINRANEGELYIELKSNSLNLSSGIQPQAETLPM